MRGTGPVRVNGDTVYVTQLFSTDLGLTSGGAPEQTSVRDPKSQVTEFPSAAAAAQAGQTATPPLRLRGAEGVAN